MVEGYQEKMDIQMEMMAWHAANLMNVHLKKKVSVKKLLGKEKTMSQADKECKLEQLKQLMKRKGA